MIGRALATGLLEAVFPPQCAACDDAGREPFCRICAEALEPAPEVEIEGADAAWAAWVYGGPASQAVQALKYGGRWTFGRALGQAMAARMPDLASVDAVVPVPMSRPALVARGYNQARELCRGIDRPVCARALSRRPGPTQVGLERAARLKNLVEALELGPEAGRIEGRRVLLVDDVITTGATAQAACARLRDAGAARVWVLAATYTPPD